MKQTFLRINNKMKQTLKAIITSSALLAMSIIPSIAQEGNVGASGWFKTCDVQGESKVCNVQYRVVAKQDGQLITSINLVEITGAVKRNIFRIIVPTGRSLPKGIQVQVDGKRSVVIPYTYCRPQLCGAEVLLSDDLVKVFKAGNGLVVTSINFQEKQNAVPITLQGFTAAFNGPPVKRENKASSREDELKKQLEDKLNQQ